MTVLVVVPDYASHLGPTIAYVRAAHPGEEVVVATGPAVRPLVERAGHRWIELVMSAGSNPGVRSVAQTDDDLGPFVAATRHGMVATLQHQAEARSHDLAWRLAEVAAATVAVVRRVRPRRVVVDHLAVAARVGLSTLDVDVTTFVPGHPSQLPIAGECYGVPPSWPDWVRPDPTALQRLRAACATVERDLATAATTARSALGADDAAVQDVFGPLGADVIAYRYRPELHDPRRGPLPTGHRFVGDCIADGARQPEVSAWIDGDPYVYASLGTFLGARADVLRAVADALGATWRLAVATGPTDPDSLGLDRTRHLVAPFLPQRQLVESATVVICHGGNNSVTEAIVAGRPVVVMPLSTDQFAIAADLDRTGRGISLDPNHLVGDEVRATVQRLAERISPGPCAARPTLGACPT